MNMDGVWILSFKSGMFMCIPAPAVSIMAIEELSKDIQKRN